jgi:phosphoribosylformimino-5-aminoimidazole carboxamide ribotide isomerase
MLIPSIDLQGGRVVQLVQGEKLAIASDDLDGWIAKFKKFPKVQLIDLDAAMSRGNNDELVSGSPPSCRAASAAACAVSVARKS